MDSLAVAIGTSHGIYPKTLKPELKLDLLKEIKDRVEHPARAARRLEQPGRRDREAVKLGINKINISSDIKVAYHTKMREVLADQSLREPLAIQPPCIDGDEGGGRTEDRPLRRSRQGITVLTWPRASSWALGAASTTNSSCPSSMLEQLVAEYRIRDGELDIIASR